MLGVLLPAKDNVGRGRPDKRNYSMVSVEDWAAGRHVSLHYAIQMLNERGATTWDVYSSEPGPGLDRAIRQLGQEMDDNPDVELLFSPQPSGPIPLHGVRGDCAQRHEYFPDVEHALHRVRELHGTPGFNDPAIYWRPKNLPEKAGMGSVACRTLWDAPCLNEYIASTPPAP